MMIRKISAITAASVLALATVGCSTPRQTGQLVGGVIGLAVGAGVGSAPAAHIVGALVGGTVGYLVGGYFGDKFTEKDHEVVKTSVETGKTTTWTSNSSTYTVTPGPVVTNNGVETRSVEVMEKESGKVEKTTVEKRDGKWKQIRG